MDGSVVRQAGASDVPYKMGAMVENPARELPADDDVIIWHLQERDGLDVYRVTKGASTVGEFTGRSIGSSVFRTAVEHAGPGRAVWLKDELSLRRLNPPSS